MVWSSPGSLIPTCWVRGVNGASAATATTIGFCLYAQEEEHKLSDTSTQVKDKVFCETNLQI